MSHKNEIGSTIGGILLSIVGQIVGWISLINFVDTILLSVIGGIVGFLTSFLMKRLFQAFKIKL